MGILEGYNILVTGIGNKNSIAAGIAAALHREGASLFLTFQNERLESRVRAIGDELNVPAERVLPFDARCEASLQALFDGIKSQWSALDGIIHAMAFAPKEELAGNFAEVTTKEGFLTAHEVSSYSLSAITQAALPLLSEKASIVTLSYLGAERVVPNYNVMGLAKASLEANVRYLASALGPKGIRVNAISAGPVRTLAASGIQDFRKMLDFNESNAPLRRNVSLDDLGNTAAFLCSHWANGITGELIHVDAGFHSVAIGAL